MKLRVTYVKITVCWWLMIGFTGRTHFVASSVVVKGREVHAGLVYLTYMLRCQSQHFHLFLPLG